MRVQLPSGGFAIVSPDVKPETLKALDRMVRAAAKQLMNSEQERGSAGRGPAAKRNRTAGLRPREKEE